jgi:hypothetical protein
VGNWRTVNIVGTIPEADVQAIRDRVTYDTVGDDWEGFGPLSYDPRNPGLCGLDRWPQPQVFAAGNLAERDYSVEDVAEALAGLAVLSPGMVLKVHCGGERESTSCVATISVRDGQVTVGPAEVDQVAPVSNEVATGRILGYLTGWNGRP